MKPLLLLGMAGLVVGGIVLTVGSSSYEHTTEVETIEVEVTPAWAEDPDAVKAAQDVIRRKELKAEQEVLDAQIKILETRQAEIEKELGF